MTINTLIDALISFLSEKTQNIILTTEAGIEKTPQYVNGYLPPKKSTDIEDFPFIIVRPNNGSDTPSNIGMSGDVAVKILIGTHSEDPHGYQDAVTLLEIIRRELLTQRVINKQFELQLFSWQFPDEQPFPHWYIELTTNWAVLVPSEQNYMTEGAL